MTATLKSGFVELDPPSFKLHHSCCQHGQDDGDVVVAIHGIQHLTGDRKLLLELSVERRQLPAVAQGEPEPGDSHSDSSAGGGAATPTPPTVEAPGLPGDDSRPEARDGDLGTLDYLNRKRDVVGMVAVDYRSELATAINLMPEDVERWHLEGLLAMVDRAVEAEAAFYAACQAVER